MCRLAMKTASEPFSPYSVLEAMEAMREGYDGSGLGLLLRGVEFADFNYNGIKPILSGIAHTEQAMHRLADFVQNRGFTLRYDHEFSTNLSMIEAKDRHKYFLRVYRLPTAWKNYSQEKIDQ